MEPGVPITESDLIEQAAAGNRAAFGEIYTRYLDVIYRYIYYHVGDALDTEDLTECVFLKAWQAIPGYRDLQLPFSSWLYRIAHNIVIDFHRRQKASPCVERRSNQEDDELPAPFFKQVSEMEDASALAQAISKLTPDQQQIILLRFIEGLNHSEIAQIMEKSEGACRMLQNRALIALHQQLNSAEEAR